MPDILRPCPGGKVKCEDHGVMITIGQLARYVGVSIKTIRVYHDKGLLAEPDRDDSGYRRYTAQDAIELIKVRTLAEAGVPLARIRALKAAQDEAFQHAVDEIDRDLTARIRNLRRLRDLGLSERSATLQRDLWILVFATHPDMALQRFQDQAQQLSHPTLRQ